MSTFEEFERDLRDALTHLYDPIYQPSETLWAVIGCNPGQGVQAVQDTIIQAVEELKPSPTVPPHARVRRVYELLRYRYILGLTQEETANRLSITPRYLRRQQREAVHILAKIFWERSRTRVPSAELPSDKPESDAKPTEWLSQIRAELASLRKSAPGASADISEVVNSAEETAHAIASKYAITLKVGPVQPNLTARIHPSALRQIVLEAVAKLSRALSSGEITLGARCEGDVITITLEAPPVAVRDLPDLSLIQEILALHDGSMEIISWDEGISLLIRLPSALPSKQVINVLVVDDNEDMIELYRSYTMGTRYEIASVTEGRHVLEAIEASAPGIIVLDVMLPDVDGWELLMQLHEHSATRSIPIIVCSVIRDKELALALGASLYLSKPVHRQQFIQALERVLP